MWRNSCIFKSYMGKTGRRAFLPFPPILNRVKVSFLNFTVTTIDNAIIKCTRLLVFCKKVFL